jgi:hypothetical protein
MDLNWPDLSQHNSDYLRLCGTVVEPTDPVAKWLKTDRLVVSSFRRRSKTYYVRFSTGGRAKKNHVHMEIASRAMLARPPKPTVKLAEIESYIDKVAGLSLKVSAAAEFESSIAELPERGLIRLFSGENKMGEVAMQMTQARFAITGSPVQTISWQLIGDGQRVSSIVEAAKTVTIGRFYMTESLEWLFGLYNLFVLGRDLSV